MTDGPQTNVIITKLTSTCLSPSLLLMIVLQQLESPLIIIDERVMIILMIDSPGASKKSLAFIGAVLEQRIELRPYALTHPIMCRQVADKSSSTREAFKFTNLAWNSNETRRQNSNNRIVVIVLLRKSVLQLIMHVGSIIGLTWISPLYLMLP